MGKYRKYVIAALTPLLVWGTRALAAWSVTRGSLVTLIWEEAAAFGVYFVPNDTGLSTGSIVSALVARLRDILNPLLPASSPAQQAQTALPVDPASQASPDTEPSA